jgi:hypothetical protein
VARGRRRRGGARGKEVRRGERSGGGDARRGGEVWLCQHHAVVPAVPCQGRVMGQAGGPWPARLFVPCRPGHAAGRVVPPMGRSKRSCRGSCHWPMGRLYTYSMDAEPHDRRQCRMFLCRGSLARGTTTGASAPTPLLTVQNRAKVHRKPAGDLVPFSPRRVLHRFVNPRIGSKPLRFSI